MIDLRDGILLPGLVDTHVHFPQVRVIGALGMPLLEWLDRCALPEEQRLASPAYAATIAGEFVAGLISAGTTTSLVFGSHFASAVDALFAEAERYGLRVTSGLVVSDRILPEPLLTTPERAYDESVELAMRWHGSGRLRYAVTPRFSLSASDPILAACGAVMESVRRRLLHLARQREQRRGGHRRRPVPRPRALRRHLRPPRPPRPALRAGPRRAPHRPRARRDGGARVVGGAGAPPATPRSARGCSRCAATSTRAYVSRSAATSGPAPGSRSSRRACRPTSSSTSWVPRGCRSVPGTCST